MSIRRLAPCPRARSHTVLSAAAGTFRPAISATPKRRQRSFFAQSSASILSQRAANSEPQDLRSLKWRSQAASGNPEVPHCAGLVATAWCESE